MASVDLGQIQKEIESFIDSINKIEKRISFQGVIEKTDVEEIFKQVLALDEHLVDDDLNIIAGPLKSVERVISIFHSYDLGLELGRTISLLSDMVDYLQECLEIIKKDNSDANCKKLVEVFTSKIQKIEEELEKVLGITPEVYNYKLSRNSSLKIILDEEEEQKELEKSNQKDNAKAVKPQEEILEEVKTEEQTVENLPEELKEEENDKGEAVVAKDEDEKVESETTASSAEEAVAEAAEEEEEEEEVELSQELAEAFMAETMELMNTIEENLLVVLKNPQNEFSLMEIFRSTHTLKGNCGIFKITSIQAVSHQAETMLEMIIEKKRAPSISFFDLLLEMVDAIRGTVSNFSPGQPLVLENQEYYKEKLTEILNSSDGESEKPKESEEKPEPKVDVVNVETQELQDIRVKVEKLDVLNNLVGELVTAKVMLMESSKKFAGTDSQIEKDLKFLDRITTDLQDIAMSVRMIPVEHLFKRLARIIHDVSRKVRKQVNYSYTGEDTEIDRILMEKVTDPLVHMIRNSIDHGIENPGERIEKGKNPAGAVTLSAKSEAGEIWITVSDDGGGINKAKVLEKAIANGIIESGDNLTEEEIFHLIFAPGFSTAEAVTDLSGRGIGMDVVKLNIEKIKGRVEIASVEGQGSTFTIKIPLTLAIIQGMLLKVGSHLYTLPIDNIIESIKLDEAKISCTFDDYGFLKIREEILPVVSVRKILHLDAAPVEEDDEKLVVIIEYYGTKMALLIDRILTQYETVIRPLPKYFKKVLGIAGCSILGTGETSLILDPGSIIKHVVGDKREMIDESSAYDH